VDLLDIVLHYDCNLHCSYCTITEEMRARPPIDPKVVAAELARAAARHCTSVQFTGGEPTTRGELLPLVRFAAARGFTDVKVQTNGLLLAEPANAARLAAAGVTRVAVSVHGYTPSGPRYSRITGADDGGATMLRAIDSLRGAGVIVECDVIVMTETLDDLASAVEDLAIRGAARIQLWYVSLTDRNAAFPESLPRMSDAAPALRAAMAAGAACGAEVVSLHVPRCILRVDERHVWHPAIGRNIRVVTPDAVFDLSVSRLSGGVKPPQCATCAFDGVCPGLRADYVARFGADEAQPLVVTGGS